MTKETATLLMSNSEIALWAGQIIILDKLYERLIFLYARELEEQAKRGFRKEEEKEKFLTFLKDSSIPAMMTRTLMECACKKRGVEPVDHSPFDELTLSSKTIADVEAGIKMKEYYLETLIKEFCPGIGYIVGVERYNVFCAHYAKWNKDFLQKYRRERVKDKSDDYSSDLDNGSENNEGSKGDSVTECDTGNPSNDNDPFIQIHVRKQNIPVVGYEH